MSITIHIDIVSAEGHIFSGEAQMAYIPGIMGELGIYPRHAPLVTRLKPGEVRINNDCTRTEHFFISGGILEVQPHLITILADTAVRAADLDEAAALQAKKKAEATIADKKAEFEYTKAKVELAEAAAQLRAIENVRKLKNK